MNVVNNRPRSTYEDNLVIESHGPIAPTNKGKRFIKDFQFREKPLVFNDCRSIRIPVANPSVPSS
jgi:hypothetical protein